MAFVVPISERVKRNRQAKSEPSADSQPQPPRAAPRPRPSPLKPAAAHGGAPPAAQGITPAPRDAPPAAQGRPAQSFAPVAAPHTAERLDAEDEVQQDAALPPHYPPPTPVRLAVLALGCQRTQASARECPCPLLPSWLETARDFVYGAMHDSSKQGLVSDSRV